jgi:hypothetical protein
MNIIEAGDFSKVKDPVKTEEIINSQLIERASHISTDYHYVAIPLAWLINRSGIGETQRKIDKICSDHKEKKLFFVCQHILVRNLNFHGNLVFTPHSTVLDSFTAIPHYSCNYDVSLSKPWKEREYTFSFMGSFLTHPVRRKLYDHLKSRKDCLVIDTGSWHFEGSKEKIENNSRKYIEVLGNTKFSLCPRGTGPSTIRIWESMAMGSLPVIFSDILKMPLEMEVSDELWLRQQEKFETIDLPSRDEYNNEEYFQKFSNDCLYKTIEMNL